MTLPDRRANGPIASFIGPIESLLASSELVFYLTRRKIVTRYRGSVLGAAWVILSPALMLGIYTLVFGVIFKPRWVTETESTSEYALLLYLGLCAFWFVSECLAEAPSLIHQHANYVKKVVFPLDILVWVCISGAAFHSAIRLLVFAAACVLFDGRLPATFALVPLVWIPLVLMSLGFCWLLSAIGVFVRDLGEVVALCLTAMLFLSPVFYSIESVPEAFRWLLLLNPITWPIVHLRDVAYFGKLPEFASWGMALGVSYLVAWLGHALFLRSRRAFADVL